MVKIFLSGGEEEFKVLLMGFECVVRKVLLNEGRIVEERVGEDGKVVG